MITFATWSRSLSCCKIPFSYLRCPKVVCLTMIDSNALIVFDNEQLNIHYANVQKLEYLIWLLTGKHFPYISIRFCFWTYRITPFYIFPIFSLNAIASLWRDLKIVFLGYSTWLWHESSLNNASNSPVFEVENWRQWYHLPYVIY